MRSASPASAVSATIGARADEPCSGADALRRFEAVEARHADVEQDEVERGGGGRGDRFLARPAQW